MTDLGVFLHVVKNVSPTALAAVVGQLPHSATVHDNHFVGGMFRLSEPPPPPPFVAHVRKFLACFACSLACWLLAPFIARALFVLL